MSDVKQQVVGVSKGNMTPQRFWASIKEIAATKCAQSQLQHHLSIDLKNELIAEVSTLSSLVKELTGYPLYPLSGIEKSSSRVCCKDINK